jgi:hypothetical protein
VLETLGPVSITATTGNITLNNDIGPHIVNGTTNPDFNPLDKGVASLTMSAPASTAAISMQGARAEGNVIITTGGSLTAAKAITSVTGTVSIATGVAPPILSAVPIGSQQQLLEPTWVSPVLPPGPRAALPTPPGFASTAASGLPVFAEIPVAIADQFVDSALPPGATGGSVALSGAPGGANAPRGTTGAAGRPTVAKGAAAGAQPSGSSDPGALDTGNAVRAAGAACGDEKGSEGDTGLAAANPAGSSEESDQKKAACPPADSGSKTAAGAPASPAGNGSTRGQAKGGKH